MQDYIYGYLYTKCIMKQVLQTKTTTTKAPTDAKVKLALDTMVKQFAENQEFPASIALTYLKSYGKPSDSWSLSNRLIMKYVGQTDDARNYNDWLKVGRHVKKGEKAFAILKPRVFTYVKKDKDTGIEEKETVVAGFVGQAEFADFQTEGQPIKLVEEPKKIPELLEVAKRLGIEVKYQVIKGQWGHYSQIKKEIVLCTDDQTVFFHELIHAVQHKIDQKIKGGQDKKQEVIAELGAAVIASLYGMDTRQRSREYIQYYLNNEQSTEKVGEYCLQVVKKLEDILNYIFKVSK